MLHYVAVSYYTNQSSIAASFYCTCSVSAQIPGVEASESVDLCRVRQATVSAMAVVHYRHLALPATGPFL